MFLDKLVVELLNINFQNNHDLFTNVMHTMNSISEKDKNGKDVN